MNNPLVSIIVPVYKVERYLPRCIESILRQTYTNFELILVDDGTPDRSGIICDRYAEKDSRIRVIHKENGGVSTARNAGIDAAKGEWITFVDGDDWISDNYLQVLTLPLDERNYDLVVGRLEWRSFRARSYGIGKRFIAASEMNSFETIRLFEEMEFLGPCYKLFSKNKISEYNVHFPEGVCVAEDAIFVTQYLRLCKEIYITGEIIYYYNCLNSLSVTNRMPYFSDRSKWTLKYIENYVETLNALKVEVTSKKILIAQKTIKLYCDDMRNVICTFGEEKAKTKIRESFEDYKKHLVSSQEELFNDLNDNQKEITKCIEKQDAQYMYDILKSKEKNVFRSKVRKMFKVLLRPFLEKYRDGIVKYKF